MKKKHMFKFVMVTLLLFVTRSFPETNDNKNSTNQFYILIGNVEECKHIDWQDTSPPESTSTPLPDGKIRLTVKGNLPFQYMAFIIEDQELLKISNGIATNIYTDKKVLFMQNKRKKMRTEEGWQRKCEQLVASGKKMIFYGVPHQFPKGLIQEYELEDYFIVKKYEGNFLDLPVPEEIRYMISRIRLKKQGIILPERNKPENTNSDSSDASP